MMMATTQLMPMIVRIWLTADTFAVQRQVLALEPIQGKGNLHFQTRMMVWSSERSTRGLHWTAQIEGKTNS